MKYSLQKSTVSFPDRAPLKIRVEVTVRATPRQVWDILLDHPRWVEWYQGMVSCEDTTRPPYTKGIAGSTRRVVVEGIEATEEFIALIPEKVWAFTVFEASVPLNKKWVERVVLEPAVDGDTTGGTRIIYEAGMEPRWLGKLLRPFIVKATRDAWRKSLEGIDAYLERKEKTGS